MNWWNWLFGRKKDERRRKKRILLWTLISISLIIVVVGALFGYLYGCKSNHHTPTPNPDPNPPITSNVLSPRESDWSKFYTATSGDFDPGTNGDFVDGWQNWINNTHYDTLDLGTFSSIGASAFDNMLVDGDVSIQHLIFSGTNCTSIGNSAFVGCSSLISVAFPDSLETIGDWAFDYCTSLVTLTSFNSLTSIGIFAFQHCYDLTNITLPNTLTSVGFGAFYHCISLTSFVFVQVINASLSTFLLVDGTTGNLVTNGLPQTNAFLIKASDIPSTEGADMTIGTSVVIDEYWSYCFCFNKTLTIPSKIEGHSVTSISAAAFGGTISGVVQLTLPNSLTSIGDAAFSGCDSLNFITASYTSPPSWGGTGIFENIVNTTGNVQNTGFGYTSQAFLNYLQTPEIGLPGTWTAI